MNKRILPANFQTNDSNQNYNAETEDRRISSEQKEIVQFSNEGVTPSTDALPDIVNLSTDYLSMTTREDREHNIKDFFIATYRHSYRLVELYNASTSSIIYC